MMKIKLDLSDADCELLVKELPGDHIHDRILREWFDEVSINDIDRLMFRITWRLVTKPAYAVDLERIRSYLGLVRYLFNDEN